MLIDLTQTYLNADDSVAVTADTKQPITLKFMLVQALLSGFDSNGPVQPDDKLKRYSIYRDLKKAGDVAELPVEDIALLKSAVKIFDTLVLGQTHEMLERAAPAPIQYAPEVIVERP